jgi:hypothetical protein
MLKYDGAPREITAEEAKTIAHEEYVLRRSYGRHMVFSRGADGGMHLRYTSNSRSGQDAVVWMNTRRQDLRTRIMAGECTHTIFYNRARDTFYCA